MFKRFWNWITNKSNKQIKIDKEENKYNDELKMLKQQKENYHKKILIKNTKKELDKLKKEYER